MTGLGALDSRFRGNDRGEKGNSLAKCDRPAPEGRRRDIWKAAASLFLPLTLLLLTACADLTGAPSPPKECPKDLSFVTSQLVTPYPKLEAFIGKEALDATLHKPIDESIAHGGGIDRSIRVGQTQIKEYRNILDNADQVRAEDKKAGMSDEWIETYLSSVQDGITINQAFVDAAKCRQTQGQPEQTESVPAS